MSENLPSREEFTQVAQEACTRNLLAKAGSATLATAGAVALGAGLMSAPKTTLGIAAIGAGLLAAGNRKELDDWGQATFTKKEDTPAPATETPAVDVVAA
jgi:hypothetical protein